MQTVFFRCCKSGQNIVSFYANCSKFAVKLQMSCTRLPCGIILCCKVLWEFGNFCKHAFVDLLAMIPKWINMRGLIQQRGAVAQSSRFPCAASEFSKSFSVILTTICFHVDAFHQSVVGDFSHFPHKCLNVGVEIQIVSVIKWFC